MACSSAIFFDAQPHGGRQGDAPDQHVHDVDGALIGELFLSTPLSDHLDDLILNRRPLYSAQVLGAIASDYLVKGGTDCCGINFVAVIDHRCSSPSEYSVLIPD